MSGYYKMPELTTETVRDGWLLTNDIVYLDEDGYVYILGRADDMINTGGEKVSPIEVEHVALEYPGVGECACIGVEDPAGISGQIPVLYLTVRQADFDKKCFCKYLSKQLENYKMPKHCMILEEIPRNSMKKIDRKKLRELWKESKDQDYMNPVMLGLLNRRSVRKFTSQSIDKKILEKILLAGIYAPNGGNLQTWKFIVVQERRKIENLKIVAEMVAERRNISVYGFENPQNLILVSNDRRNRTGVQDASCAAENMLLAAQSYGLGGVWLNHLMEICDEPEIREQLNQYGVPPQHIVWAIIGIGYAEGDGVPHVRRKDVISYVDEKN